MTEETNNKPLVARQFLKGLPTAIVYALLALIAASLAATAGFLPTTIATLGTGQLVGAAVFVAELASFL